LKKARIDSGKFDYLFGKASSTKNASHNLSRTKQNLAQMRRLGVSDDANGRLLIQNHFDRIVNEPSNIIKTWTDKNSQFEIRESLFSGPGGFAKFESAWEMMSDGTRRFTTVIIKGGH
jgi:filamentous hemagglutinin